MLLEIEENYYRQLAQNVNDIEDLQIIMLQTEFNKTPFKNSPDSAFDNDFDYVNTRIMNKLTNILINRSYFFNDYENSEDIKKNHFYYKYIKYIFNIFIKQEIESIKSIKYKERLKQGYFNNTFANFELFQKEDDIQIKKLEKEILMLLDNNNCTISKNILLDEIKIKKNCPIKKLSKQ